MKLKQILAVTKYNFRQWHKNPRIVITFCLAFVLCFLLSDKAVKFAKEYETTMQIVEAFVWTFGDSNSILLSSLLLLLLFADMPFISSGTPFYLMRIDRKTWLTGQAVYIVLATFLYLAFILVSTSLVCMRQSFVGNMWSETAAILGYSGAGQKVALPALVKTLEMSRPYECMATIFLLMLLYTLLILDEPLNGLDKHGVREMRKLIKGLKEQGKTILLASHNQGDIDELCDTVCEMDAGVMTMIREESI